MKDRKMHLIDFKYLNTVNVEIERFQSQVWIKLNSLFSRVKDVKSSSSENIIKEDREEKWQILPHFTR